MRGFLFLRFLGYNLREIDQFDLPWRLMKKLLPLLLVLSLAANAALLVLRPCPASSTKTPFTTKPTAANSTPAPNPKLPSDLTAALASGNEAALKAAGFSDDDARAIYLGRSFARLLTQMRELRGQSPGDQGKYWRGNRSRYELMSAEQRAGMAKLEREFREVMRKTFGDDDELGIFGSNRFRFLSPAKREEMRRIERDYEEMTAEVHRQQEGISLPSDRAKMELLQKEKERDILAALTPEERELNDLYNSPVANNVRSRYGDLIQTEQDFKKIYALQKAFDEQFPQRRESGQRPSVPAGYTEAQRKLNDDIRAIIGDDAIAAYRRDNDQDIRALNALQTRLNLPAGTVEQVSALRDTYATQSQAINANTSLTPAQRREQLTALANQAKAEAAAKLGQEGAEAYASRSAWIGMLSRGQGFSTNPKDASGIGNIRSTVFPLRPQARGQNQQQPVTDEP